MQSTSFKDKLYSSFEQGSSIGFADIDSAKQQYITMMPFSESEEAGLHSYSEAFKVRLNYDTNALEGSTLTLAETALVLEGEWLPNKETRYIYAAKGIAEADQYIDMLLGEFRPSHSVPTGSVPITQALIKDIHERIAQDITVPNRGIYRSEAVYIKGSTVATSNVSQIRGHMDDLLYAYSNSKLHPIEKAAAFHVFFENIHPFRDGNGRTGRMLLNLMLQNAGYQPINLKSDHRAAYLEALGAWQLRCEKSPFISIVKTSELAELSNKIAIIQEAREAQGVLGES